MKKILGITLMLTMLVGTGCGKLEDMGNNAEAAKDNSGRAADAASESREEIANSRAMGRSGATSAARRKALNAMMDMKSFDMKVTEAAKFMKGFEYQLWTGQRYDTAEYLLKMKLEAVNELFRASTEVFGKSIEGATLKPTSILPGKRDKSLNVMALATALHQVHIVQDEITVGTNNKLPEAETMLSILKRTLTKIDKIEKGELAYSSLAKYEEAVYEYKGEAIKLLEARVEMMLLMTLSRVSQLKDSTLKGLGLLYLKRSFKTRYFKLSLGRQNKINDYMREARKTSEFLASIGVTLKKDTRVRKTLAKMTFPNAKKLGEMSAQSGPALMGVQNHQSFVTDLAHFYKIKDGELEIK